MMIGHHPTNLQINEIFYSKYISIEKSIEGENNITKNLKESNVITLYQDQITISCKKKHLVEDLNLQRFFLMIKNYFREINILKVHITKNLFT